MFNSLKPTFFISALCLIGLLLAVLVYIWEFIGVKEKFASKSEPQLWGGNSDTDNLTLDPFKIKNKSTGLNLNLKDECSKFDGKPPQCGAFARSSGIDCIFLMRENKCVRRADLSSVPCMKFSGKGKDFCESNKDGIRCIYRENGMCTGPKNEHEICDQHNARDSKGVMRATAECRNASNLTNGTVSCDVDLDSGKCVSAKLVNNQKHTAELDICSMNCPTREACNAVKLKEAGKSGVACQWVEGTVDKNGAPVKAARCIPMHEPVKVENPASLLGVHSTSKPTSVVKQAIVSEMLRKGEMPPKSSKGSAGTRSSKGMGKKGTRGSGGKKRMGKKGSRRSKSSKSSRGSKGKKRMGKKGSRRSKSSKSSRGSKGKKRMGKKGSRGSKRSKSSKSSRGSKGKKRMGKKGSRGSKRSKSSKSSKSSRRSKSSRGSKGKKRMGKKGSRGKKGSKRSKSSKSSRGSKGKKGSRRSSKRSSRSSKGKKGGKKKRQ